MAEYVWLNVYPKDSVHWPFGLNRSNEDATNNAGPNRISCDRYRVEERDGTRVLLYDPEPKYEQRDMNLVYRIRETSQGQPWKCLLSNKQAAELVAKHRQSEVLR